ncbi:MAG: hypothetical protein HY889_06715 [Deltaproteobacteria bacterium]|nr:hypothetical protein [Deltaproteobacteria bacterium]
MKPTRVVHPETQHFPLFGLISKNSSTGGIIIGCLVLAGWWLDIPMLKGGLPNPPYMVPNTALGFIFACVSLRLLNGAETGP